MGHSPSLTTQQKIRIRLRAFERSFRIQPEPATQSVVARRSFLTQPGSKTPLLVLFRFKATRPVTTIRLRVLRLNGNTTGKLNTAVGVGCLASSTGDLNIAFGFGAGANLTTGNNNIDVGNIGVPTEDNVIRVGGQVAVTDPFGVLHPAHTATYIAGIRDANAAGGDAVFVTTDGKLGTINVPSAARFKDEIRAMDKTSEAILALKTVTFCYKKELNPNRVPQFGLVAEEVEKTAPDLVKRDHTAISRPSATTQ